MGALNFAPFLTYIRYAGGLRSATISGNVGNPSAEGSLSGPDFQTWIRNI